MENQDALILGHIEAANSFPQFAWATAFAFMLMSPIIVAGNVLVLASILLDPFKNITNAPSSYIIFNLALADLLVGVVTLPLTAGFYIYFLINNREPFSGLIVTFVTLNSCGVSLFSLIALSTDRLIAVASPLKYVCRVTKKKITIFNILMWVYSSLLGILHMFKNINSFNNTVAATHILIALVILAVLNAALVLSVHHQGTKLRKAFESENQSVLQIAYNREKAATRVAVIIIVTFEICLLPIVIIVYIIAFSNIVDWNTKMIYVSVYFLALVLFIFNSLINPFIYAWRLPKYRKAFQHIINQIKKNIYSSASKCRARKTQETADYQDNQNSGKVCDKFQFLNRERLELSPITTTVPLCGAIEATGINKHVEILKVQETIQTKDSLNCSDISFAVMNEAGESKYISEKHQE